MKSKYENLVNFKVSVKNREIKLMYLYVFEQIASLYIYTISNFHGDRKSIGIFMQKIRFTSAITQKLSYDGAVNAKQVKEKIAYVLSFLDEGYKALDILEKIKSEDSVLSERDVSLVEDAMEENSIIFPSSSSHHPYSFQTMYSILKDPLSIFQRFLRLPSPGDLLNNIIKCRLKEKIDRDELLGKEPDTKSYLLNRRKRFHSQSNSPLNLKKVIESNNDKEVTFESLLKACSDEKIKIDTTDFSDLISRSIDEVLQDWSLCVLELLLPNNSYYLPMIDSLIDSDLLKQEGIIKLNKEDLTKLCLLGQTDQISEMLSKKIKELYIRDKAQKDKLLHTDISQLSAIAKWQQNCRMGYIKEVSQIPSMISALLYNRLEDWELYEYVLCSQKAIVDFSEKNRVDSLQQLVTYIIYKYLYHADSNISLPYKSQSLERIDTINSYFDSEKSVESDDLLPNESMIDWAYYDKTKTRDRFKRPLKKLPTFIFQANYKIEWQKQAGIHHYFPVSNNYPLPFWAMK